MSKKDNKFWFIMEKPEVKTILIAVMASLATNAIVLLLLLAFLPQR